MEQTQAQTSKARQMLDFAAQHFDHLSHLPKALFDVKIQIVTLRGPLRRSDAVATLLYVGRGVNLVYLQKNIFKEVEVVARQTATLFAAKSKLAAREATVDATFVDIGWPYHGLINKGGDYLEIPDWVDMYVPLHGTWEDVEKRFRQTTRRNDLRLMRRNNYTFEARTDDDTITGFYDDYYLPFINHRHAGEVIVSSRKLVERRARQGAILRVNREDGPVAASVVYPQDGVLHSLWTGVPAHFVENPPEASISALNYFCLKYAYDNGYKVVDLMGTRAFPTDGIFQFKRRWGAIADDSFSPSSILFKPAANSLKAAQFCESYPVLARRNGTLEQVLCNTSPEFDDAECNSLVSRFACEGIDRVTVVNVSETRAGSAPQITSKYPNVRVIHRDLATFAESYTRSFDPNSAHPN